MDFYCGCYNSGSVHSNRNCLYLILKVVHVYFFSRCLQTVLPHIHLLWELALTNEVLFVQL